MSQLWGMRMNPALFTNSENAGQIPLVSSFASRVPCVSGWYTAPLVVKKGSFTSRCAEETPKKQTLLYLLPLPTIPIKPQPGHCTSSIVITTPGTIPCFWLQDLKSKLLYCNLWAVWNKRTMTVVKNQWWYIDRAHKIADPKVQKPPHPHLLPF
jgi:hypothetical protein